VPDPKAAPASPAGAVPSSAVANADPAAPAAAVPEGGAPADNGSGPDKAALDRGVAGLK
jgi:hypothetical protein